MNRSYKRREGKVRPGLQTRRDPRIQRDCRRQGAAQSSERRCCDLAILGMRDEPRTGSRDGSLFARAPLRLVTHGRTNYLARAGAAANSYDRMKHVARRHYFVRDMVESFEIEVPFVTTDRNAADMLTKCMKNANKSFEFRAIITNEPMVIDAVKASGSARARRSVSGG